MTERLTDDHFNRFVTGFVARFSERAVGLDSGSARLVGERPADHVLAGFLTPIHDEESAATEESLADDLPRDTVYEQTSIGLHWLVPDDALDTDIEIALEVEFCVFIRRCPTRQEQIEDALWRTDRETGAEFTTLLPIWTRECVGPIEIDGVGLAHLAAHGRLQLPIAEEVAARLADRIGADAYPGRRPVRLSREDLADDLAYARAVTGSDRLPLVWRPVIDLRVSAMTAESGCNRLSLRVLNASDDVPPRSRDYADPNLYAVRLTARVPRAAHQPTVFRELPQSFRYDRRMVAVGINADVQASEEDGDLTLRTESVPRHNAPRLEPREIRGAPDFQTLSEDPESVLRGILEAMRDYDSKEWASALKASLGEHERQEAERAREDYNKEIARFERGVRLLADPQYPAVRRAFELMNTAMLRASRGRYHSWRLFQIAFIVSQIPGLAGREYAELYEEDDGDVDVLWFAAGGGKTEAFLGLILWQAFFDRLRGKEIGVAAFVRFPLRLLTFQQLQRLGAALAAAEQLRIEHELGGARFSIGYYVGRGTTPNAIDRDAHSRYRTHGPDAKFRRLYQCGFCEAQTEVRYNAEERLIEHWCVNSGTSCPNGRRRLPIYVVDADVYRFLPTIVVSTVDKLAQFGQNQRFGQLLGRISAVCPVHGATFLGANSGCSAAAELGRGEQPECCGESSVRYGPFHDLGPSLLVQDELHLLSEELGTFDGHYETAVAEAARSLGGKPWEVIAATATIERYQDHAWHLYLRQARQFPGPGPQAYESFYYTQNERRLGRLFVGVLGVGRKHTPAVTRTLSLLYMELEKARELASADIREASARYGLGPLERAQFDALVFCYELVLTYVLTRKGSDQVAEAIDSRVRQELLDAAPTHGDLRVETFNGGVSEAEMSAAVQRIRDADPETDPAERLRGLVATNVIGHGVDVDRFNVMVFAGFPRLVAEYIQASARVGRTFPGISVFVATPQSERDRSVFDRFSKFHEYLDRLVDPSAINRWPLPAMERTVPGVLAGYLMAVASGAEVRRVATVEQVQDAHAEGLHAFAMGAIVAWMRRSYGVNAAPSGDAYKDRLSTVVQNRYASIINRQRIYGGRQHALNMELHSMQSLRDTDDPGQITANRTEDAAILRKLTRG